MKFYYNGKLVRTSKTHEYHFAIINPESGNVWSCHGTRDAAVKEFRRPIAEAESGIETSKRAIKAIEAGRPYIIEKQGRYSYKIDLKGKDIFGLDRSLVNTWEEYIESDLKRIKELEKRQIVELEMK